MIKGLMPGLPERGKIKIGIKGKEIMSRQGNTFQPPQKLDHFVITSVVRGADGNFTRDDDIHTKLGDAPKEIPIRLLFDDIDLNFPTRFVAYKGKTVWCSGDGETARRLSDQGSHQECPCPCPRVQPGYKGTDKCKINGKLSVLIDGAGGVGGIWNFRTTSWNTVTGILSSLTLMQRITGGPLAGIPLKMVIRPKAATDPEGKAVTIYVVALEFPGTVEELRGNGLAIATDVAKHTLQIRHIEDQARLLLAAPAANGAAFHDEEPEDIADEFYPPVQEAAPAADGPAGKPAGRLDALAATLPAGEPRTVGDILDGLPPVDYDDIDGGGSAPPPADAASASDPAQPPAGAPTKLPASRDEWIAWVKAAKAEIARADSARGLEDLMRGWTTSGHLTELRHAAEKTHEKLVEYYTERLDDLRTASFGAGDRMLARAGGRATLKGPASPPSEYPERWGGME